MIDVIGWAIAVAIALVAAVSCGYELRWKVRRLRDELHHLDEVRAELSRTWPAETEAIRTRLRAIAEVAPSLRSR